jgi:hypothetical protein
MEDFASIENTLGKGFDVVEETVIEDLTGVKQERDLLPPTKDVKFRIKSASVKVNGDNTFRQINLQLSIVDGIQVGDVVKYKNKPMFQTVCYYADPNKYTKEYFQKRQHLVQLKMLCNALGEDLAGVRINDAYLGLAGKEVLANIKQSKKKDWTNKEGQLMVGEMQNEVVDFKKSELI